jgi:dihydrofolate reductase
VRQYLEARLIDDLHLAMSPVLMGRGEPLFAGLDWKKSGYVCDRQIAGERATHLLMRRTH